ncbi:DUF6053 domain-containing protein [Lysobacter enzymogenes]|uniref:DUF6053 domain-containing protein n=1 Tax=Lysobacter enzymogenes TaxID=69 RepID=UPI003D188E09
MRWKACWKSCAARSKPEPVGGPSGPMLLCQIAADRPESLGPEGPPTSAGPKPVPEMACPCGHTKLYKLNRVPARSIPP